MNLHSDPLVTDDCDGQSIFLAQITAIESVIAYVCRRQHLAKADADEFGSHVKLKLIEDNYAVLRKFQGRSSVATYLAVVIQRLFLDYRISAWGKWRPSAEAKRTGPVGVLLEQLLTRDGFSFEQAYEILKTNHRVTLARSELEDLVGRLPVRLRRRFERDELAAVMPSNDTPVDEMLATKGQGSAALRLSGGLQSLIGELDLRDQLVLAMRFKDGRTVAEIAATLRLDQKELYRHMDRLLRRLRVGLEAKGFEAGEVIGMLEGHDVSIDWQRGRVRKAISRQSLPTGVPECL